MPESFSHILSCCRTIGAGNHGFGVRLPLGFCAIVAVSALLMVLNSCGKSGANPAESSQEGWTITGKTYLVGSKSPVGGVTVKCAGVSTVSGADGSYQLRGIPGGIQILTAEYPKAEAYSDSLDVTSDLTYFVFVAIRYTNISGYVSNAVDGPVNGAVVSFSGLVTHTDLSGYYLFTKVPRTTDTLTISHPDYLLFKTSFALVTPDTSYDVQLIRELSVTGVVTANTYVDQARPTDILPTPASSDQLLLCTNGYDSAGVTHVGIEQNILVGISFPRFMSDSHVTIVDGSLQLYADSLPSSFNLFTYSIGSSWTASVTYRTQPALGILLSNVVIPKNAAPGYITVLSVGGLNQVLSQYRARGLSYGVELRGGTFTSTVFHSSVAPTNQPKLTMKVRY